MNKHINRLVIDVKVNKFTDIVVNSIIIKPFSYFLICFSLISTSSSVHICNKVVLGKFYM